MATDGPIPDPCDPKVYEKGKTIFVSASIPSNAFERWVTKVRLLSGQRVDWFFCGGRAVVKYIGDRSRVKEAIEQLLEEHNKLQYEAVLKMSSGIAEEWKPNYMWR